MKLNAGDRVLSTDQEHEGGTECWKYLVERRGILLETVAISGEMDDPAIVANIAAGIRVNKGDQPQSCPVDDWTEDAGRRNCRDGAGEGRPVRGRWRTSGRRHASGRQGAWLPCSPPPPGTSGSSGQGHRPPLYQRRCRRRDQAGPVDEGQEVRVTFHRRWATGAGDGPGRGAHRGCKCAWTCRHRASQSRAPPTAPMRHSRTSTNDECGAEGQDRPSRRWCRSNCRPPSSAAR